jgi:hypothetical protein
MDVLHRLAQTRPPSPAEAVGEKLSPDQAHRLRPRPEARRRHDPHRAISQYRSLALVKGNQGIHRVRELRT